MLGAQSPQRTTPTQQRAEQTRTQTQTHLLSSGVSCLASAWLQNASSSLPCGWRDGAPITQHRGTFLSQEPTREARAGWTETSRHQILVLVPSRSSWDQSGAWGGNSETRLCRVPVVLSRGRPPTDMPTPRCAQNSLSDPLKISEEPRAVQATPAGGPWGCRESAQRPSCHPAGAGHLRGRGCGHCVPAPPVGGAEAFPKSSRRQLWLSLSRPQAWARLCPQACHQRHGQAQRRGTGTDRDDKHPHAEPTGICLPETRLQLPQAP